VLSIFQLLCLLAVQADLSSNMFSGPIPAVMSQSAVLVYLNVSNNQLSGIEAPEAWSTPALMTLDASYNQIQGEQRNKPPPWRFCAEGSHSPVGPLA
jgi:hypothetical protein